MCKNRIKYRTNVAISPENRKDVGYLAWKICGFEIDASSLVVLFYIPQTSHILQS